MATNFEITPEVRLKIYKQVLEALKKDRYYLTCICEAFADIQFKNLSMTIPSDGFVELKKCLKAS